MRLRTLHGLLFLMVLSALTATALETAPQFRARTLGGETLTNDSLRGQVVLLQFWTTWCPVCRGQEAAINDITRDFASDGLVVIAVDMDEDAQTVKDYLAVHSRSCQIALADDSDLVSAFSPSGVPYYVVIDREGSIAATAAGGGEPWLRWALGRAGLGQSSANATSGSGQRSSAPRTAHVVVPKLIEVPGGPSTQPAKPRPPTVFLLKNGEKLEARRYTITGGSLHIAVDGKQRTIALADLDLKASTAANQERGIKLRIPTNPNEIVMGF